MKHNHWIFESAILIALGTCILYSLGHFFYYRIRYEFDIHTISLGVPTEVLIHDGATVIFAWFGSTKEFWIALIITSIVLVLYFLINNNLQNFFRVNLLSISMLSTVIILYVSVIKYIPSRAGYNASAIVKLASSKRQLITLNNAETLEGYTIMGTPTKLAFLTFDNIVLVFEHSEIKNIAVTSAN